MDESWIELQSRAAAEFTRRMDAVIDWSAPTPNTEWNIDTLVRHVIDEQQWVPPLLRGLTVEEAQLLIEPVVDDLHAEWMRHSAAAAQAWRGAGSDTPVHLSYGTVATLDYLKEMVADATIHSWDLARATGSDEQLDGLLVEAVWQFYEPQRDRLASSRLFAEPVGVPENAPLQHRMLALTGRDPR